jgi:ATP-binding cassette subfamily B protein
LSASPDALHEPDTEPIPFDSLEFRNVSFQYPSGDRLILDGLSFALESGKHYAFVGKNGAGKTTITKLLTGLYNEYEGEILINGKELREYPASTLKALFSVVYQDFAKYYVSMKDNIMVGDIAKRTDEPSPCPAAEAAQLAGLEDTIAELKDGMDTPLGKILEDGQDISGGQWQRVAIARSLISRAPVKMLDEPTAALDPISESRVYSEFEKLMQGKTTVFISHRLGSTKLADEILVIDDGKIIERGAHDELMEADGQYAEMFEAQRGWYL